MFPLLTSNALKRASFVWRVNEFLNRPVDGAGDAAGKETGRETDIQGAGAGGGAQHLALFLTSAGVEQAAP